MSFITRCPACATAFRVVPDQLKISEGWVRCGHCQQIFDATLDLQPWWPGSEAGAPAPAQVSGVALPAQEAPPAEEAPAAEPPASHSVPPDGPDADAPTPSVPPPPSSTAPASHTDPQEPYLAPLAPLEPQPPATASDLAVQHPVEPSVDTGSNATVEAPAQDSPSTAPRMAAVDEAPLFADEPTPSFVRQAQRRAYWRRPGVRAVLALLALCLLGLAAVQAALHWRDVWAARAPVLAEPLGQLCQLADCRVETPRLLQEVVIDSSVLLRKDVGRYLFNAVLRNHSDLEVAAPALELTLTDAQDRVLVRRVLLPQEWPEPVTTLPPRSERPLQFELDLPMNESQVMTGYRALLFYP